MSLGLTVQKIQNKSVPVENVIAETLAKSPPPFRVLIIYFGRRRGEGEREEGLYFISFCRDSGRGRRRRREILAISPSVSLRPPGTIPFSFCTRSALFQILG